MNRSRRRVTRTLSGAIVLAAAGAHLYGSPVARADIGAPIIPSFLANPFVINCSFGLCVYGTTEAGIAGTTDNPYPSTSIVGYSSPDGLTWTSRGTVFTESQLYVGMAHGFVTSPNHLGGPSVAEKGGKFYLYVSAVRDGSSAGVHTTRRTAVAQSDNPFGPYTVIGQVHFSENTVDQGAEYVDYARAFQDQGGPRYLVWSDGDSTNCGGLAMSDLADDMMTISGRNWRQLNPGPTGFLGGCPGKNHPFSEAATLFNSNELIIDPTHLLLPGPYIMIFSAKPTSTPTECTSDKGQPGTSLEVVAYATAPSAIGPYTYQGILNCGSSTEKTNHATFTLKGSVPGNGIRAVMIYDDGPGGSVPKRKLHAECLFHGANVFAGVLRSTTAWTECMTGADGKNIVLRARNGGGIVSAPSSGAQLITNRFAAGPWERFVAYDPNNEVTNVLANDVTIMARSNNKYLCADVGTNHPIRALKTTNTDPCSSFMTDSHPQTGNYLTLRSNQYFCLWAASSSLVSCSGQTETFPNKFDRLRLGFPE